MATLAKTRTACLIATCILVFGVGAHAQTGNALDIWASTIPTAQPDEPLVLNQVTVGIGGATDASAYFGRYNGMPNSGAGFLGAFNIQRRDKWDSGTARYLSVTGNDLNFGFGRAGPQASIQFKTGEQGKWSVFADYDATTYISNDSYLTLLDKYGNLSAKYQAVLAAAGLYFSNSATPPPVTAKFGSFNASTHLASSNPTTVYGPGNQLSNGIGTRRDKATVGASADLGDWIVAAVYSREHKDGSLEQAMTTGGNNAGMVTFPMPVNYDTDNFVASAAYTTPDFQAKFSYVFSNFSDHNSDGYVFQGWNFSAFKNTKVTPNLYTSYARSGVYAQPPNNQAHTLKAEVGYNFDPTTRLYGTFVFGLQMQNDAFDLPTRLDYVLSNPVMSAQLASNPSSLDGLVETYFANITFTTRPAPDWDFKATYTVDARDAQTKPMWIYGDPTDNTSLKYREAVPESWLKQAFTVEAGYHFTRSTRLTVDYAHRDAQRSNAITHRAIEDEETVKLYSTFTPELTGSLAFTHSDRSASAPDYSLWLVQIPSDCGSTTALLGCQQVPFYEAARRQNAVTGMLMGALDRDLSLSIYGKFADNKYNLPASVYNSVTLPSVGVYHDYNVQAGPDLTYQLNPDAELHAYYTFLRTYRGMRALNDQNNPTIPNMFYYTVQSTYDIHTAGAGATWHVSDQLKLVADYTFSYGGERFNQSGSWDTGEGGQTFGGDPLLTNGTGIHQFKVHGTYDFSESTSVYLGYQFDSMAMSDWTLIGPTVGQVLSGKLPVHYNVSTIMAAMTMRI
jgi:MtrB/PioB family decaheme-associated outer membrane protein